MGKITYALKRHPLTARPFAYCKAKKDLAYRMWCTKGKYTFVDRSHGAEHLLLVLAGYKERCYPSTLGRIAQEAPEWLDVCVISSGLESPTLSDWCERHGWSYLSTHRNNVCLAQNIAIELHQHAQHIFKLDEDIFICRDYFDRMVAARELALQSPYRPGIIAPLINLNGFASFHLIQRLGLLDDFEQRFEPLKCETGREHPIESRPDVARYIWGEGGIVPSLDDIDAMLGKDEPRVIPCPNVFSIGAILFERSMWEQMGFFPVSVTGNSLGHDEGRLCNYCHSSSQPVMVSMNLAVGHLSFKPQNQAMMEYYAEHEELFLPQRRA